MTWRPATGRWSSCCTASRSSGTAGGCRSRRSRRRASGRRARHPRLQPVCPRTRPASRPTALTSSPRHHGLIQERGAQSALVLGHDWGGTIARTLAMNHPEVVDRLAILNAAHPRRLNEGTAQPAPAAEVLVLLLLPTSWAARAPGPRPALAVPPALPARRRPPVHASGHPTLRRGVVAAKGSPRRRRGAAGVREPLFTSTRPTRPARPARSPIGGLRATQAPRRRDPRPDHRALCPL
jgi:pimeloyl-ACP methyl ester carboxylesterase